MKKLQTTKLTIAILLATTIIACGKVPDSIALPQASVTQDPLPSAPVTPPTATSSVITVTIPSISQAQLNRCGPSSVVGVYQDPVNGTDVTFNNDCTGYRHSCNSTFIWDTNWYTNAMIMTVLATDNIPGCPAVGTYNCYTQSFGSNPVKLASTCPGIEGSNPSSTMNALIWEGMAQ